MLPIISGREARPGARKITTRQRSMLFVSLPAIMLGVALSVVSGSGRRLISSCARSIEGQGASAAFTTGRVALRKEAAQNADLLVGPNFRISQVSAAGPDRDAASPAITYNAEDNEYLVVWSGNGLSGSKMGKADEILGRRVSAATGAPVGADFRISNISDGGKDRAAFGPKAVYNSTSHEYLVVWHGTGPQDAPAEVSEIYGQRLNRTGGELGKDFRISSATELGKINDVFTRASSHADVAWNSADNQYLVVWDAMGLPDEVIRLEVFGQLLDGAGGPVGKNFRISNTTEQGAEFNANSPQVAYNSTGNQYLVVWSGPSKVKSQNEIWAQGLSAQGAQLGKGNGDFLVSQVSTNVGSDRDASAPQVVYNSSSNEYLVVFQANAVAGVDNVQANEVFGQRINAATLGEVGPNDFRISNTPGSFRDRADNPRVAFNSLDKEYLVVWRGIRRDVPSEIFGQRVSLTGTEIDADFQISNIASVAKDRAVNLAAVAYNKAGGEYLAVWDGDELPGPTMRRVTEIFGQRIKTAAKRLGP
ncbi:MAG TPA: hypothetical protein VIW80_00775 [Pyrinomonadaceae bacterium]